MGWNRYGRASGWDKLGEAIAMMAMSGNMNFAAPGAKMRWQFDSDEGEGEGPEGFRGPGRRRERRGRMFAQGELRLALLALIAEQPSHGYELIKQIEEMTGGAYAPSPGAVYPTLQMLADEGQIEEAEAEGAKKPFAATDAGRAELEDRKDEVEELMRRLGRHASRAERMRSPDLFRAMGNLGTVLKNRARSGKLDERTINEIVDMIDEMAKRIERL
ncbi:MAG: PadR family transcriptional regulator [Porphyrobacter sp.]|nr:PadR family transcriptional regulator [Porphyrobacter sp.]